MLTKLLVTIAVIIIVSLVFRNQRTPVVRRQQSAEPKTDQGIKTQTVAYAIVGVMIVVGGILWVLDWRESHRIINIEVTSSGTGEQVKYQAYQKDIDGKQFITLDGRSVTVGDSERVEMIAR